MKLFRDQSSPSHLGEFTLLLANVGMSMTATMGIILNVHGSYPILDLVVMAIWILIPQVIAFSLTDRDWPDSFAFSTLWAALLAMTLGFLGVFGWGFLTNSGLDMASEIAVLMTISWAVSMFLFFRPCYRLFDTMTTGLVLLGLFEGHDHPAIYVSCFFFALLLSCALRHQVTTLSIRQKKTRVNLRDPLTLAAIGLLSFIFVFCGLRLTLRDWEPNLAAFFETDHDPAAEDFEPVKKTENSGATSSIFPSGGLDKRLNLRDLSRPRNAKGIAYKLKFTRGSSANSIEPGDYGISQSTLFKAFHYDKYENNAWFQSDGRTEHFDAIEKGRHIPITRKEKYAKSRMGMTSIHFLLNDPRKQDFDVFPVNYGAISIFPISGFEGGQAAYLHGNGAYTVLAPDHPRMATGREFITKFVPARVEFINHPDSTWITLTESDMKKHHGASLTNAKIPDTPENAAVRQAFAEIFPTQPRYVHEAIRRVYEFFTREGHSFVYDQDSDWQVEEVHRLRTFLTISKRGDCCYFAWATALALREVGIHTRMTVGFSGFDWHEKHGWVILNKSLHAWLEVYYGDRLGWYPIDPTTWVPSTEDGSEAAGPNEESAGQPEAQKISSAKKGDFAQDRVAIWFLLLSGLGIAVLLVREWRRRETVDDTTLTEQRHNELFKIFGDQVAWQILEQYEAWQQNLGKERLQRKPHETPREHGAIMIKKHSTEISEAMDFVSLCTELAAYGKSENLTTRQVYLFGIAVQKLQLEQERSAQT